MFCHNVATIYTMLEKDVGPPPQPTGSSKAVGFYDPTTQVEEPTKLPISPHYVPLPCIGVNANLKLLRRQGMLDNMHLQPHLKMAAHSALQGLDSSAWG